MTTNKEIIALINREVVPALGCTEPIAAALAAAKAREVLGVIPEKIVLSVSGNILKNAMAVGIPGTGMTGLPIAVALGAVGGDPSQGLEVLSGVNEEQLALARSMVSDHRVQILHKPQPEMIFIECLAEQGSDRAKVVIRHQHTNITYIEKNGEVLHEAADNKAGKPLRAEYPELSVERIYKFATESSFDDIQFILEAAELNMVVAREGLTNEYGMQVGKKSVEFINRGILHEDIKVYAMAITSAASDARMDGCTLPVMTNSGSGNQGITATLPVCAVAEKLDSSEEQLARALILSNTITIHIKSYMGRLSALCGVLVAATGAAAGITYLLGGSYTQITYAVKNMVGGITGMICDGAKVGCALKVSAATSSAVQTALLAMDNIGISHLDGIIDEDIEETIRNVGLIGAEGMVETDKLILRTMLRK